MEHYNGWVIDEKNVPLGFFRSDGQVKLEATIYPDVPFLYEILRSKGLVSMSASALVSFVKRLGYSRSNIDIYASGSDKKDLSIFNALAEYSLKHQYTTTQSAHSILSIDATGSTRTYRKAMTKIENYINVNLPNVRREAIAFLKSRNLVPQSTVVY